LVSRSSGLSGDANAAPVELGHLFGGRSFPHVELIHPLVFLLLVADVVADRGLHLGPPSTQNIHAPRSFGRHGFASAPHTPATHRAFRETGRTGFGDDVDHAGLRFCRAPPYTARSSRSPLKLRRSTCEHRADQANARCYPCRRSCGCFAGRLTVYHQQRRRPESAPPPPLAAPCEGLHLPQEQPAPTAQSCGPFNGRSSTALLSTTACNVESSVCHPAATACALSHSRSPVD